jgi:hypothetical protein
MRNVILEPIFIETNLQRQEGQEFCCIGQDSQSEQILFLEVAECFVLATECFHCYLARHAYSLRQLFMWNTRNITDTHAT